MNRAFAALDAEKSAALEADILDLVEKSNWGTGGSLAIPASYLEAVISKAWGRGLRPIVLARRKLLLGAREPTLACRLRPAVQKPTSTMRPRRLPIARRSRSPPLKAPRLTC